MKIKQIDIKKTWWNKVRFGVFFHWGVYSYLERGEWVRYLERIPFDEYRKLAKHFKPKKNWADQWMQFIKRAGAGYAVITTKHHDGYCLFDTKTSDDFSAPTTGPGRDLIAEYVKACRKHKIKVGFYYSAPDWRYFWDESKGMIITPKKNKKYSEYKKTVLTHIEELCSNYGSIDYWWWDGAPPEKEKTIAKMQSLQPKMLINDRCGLKLGIASAEKKLSSPISPSYDWECSMTSNDHWGYFGSGDDCWMTVRKSIHWMVTAGSHSGNFLYNIGPKVDGTIPSKGKRLFSGIGDWLKTYGDSYYNCEESVIEGGCSGCTTCNGNTTYLHIHHYTYPYYVIISPGIKIRSAYIMKTNKKLSIEQQGERVLLTGLPTKAPDIHDTVIVLKTDKPSSVLCENVVKKKKTKSTKEDQEILYGK